MAQATLTVETPVQLKGFKRFVDTVMRDWKVPGVAMAIVKDGEVVLSQGFGLRDVAGELPVTPHTLFPLASVTKAFTTTAMAILADDGLLDWDTPVRRYIPSFTLHDPFASERMTPRDLVTHRSGLPRHDLMWYHSSFTRQEIFDRLRYLQPSKDFRTVWQYSNLMYMAAGLLVGRLTDSTWEAFVQERIFDPLGMVSTNFSIAMSKHAADVSRPHKKDKDSVEEMSYYEDQDAIGPAGAIVSNVADMSRWLLLQLNRGMHDGVQIVSEGQIAQLHTPQMVVQQPSKYLEMPHMSYALGWSVQPYRGHNMVQHSGGIDGFSTLCTFLPQDNAGVVVLTNLAGNPVPQILTLNIFDRLLGLDPAPWSGRFRQDYDEMEGAEEKGKEKSESGRVSGTQPSHPLEAYTGTFEHPGYGTISIQGEGEGLTATFNSTNLALEHYHYDVFDLVYDLWGQRMKAIFTTSARGDIDGFSVNLEPMVPDIVFRRTASNEMRQRSFLERFVGTYELMGRRMSVRLRGDSALLIAVPGQPEFELEPYKGTEFAIRGHSGFSVEFKIGNAGVVTEAIVTQPHGVFAAPRK